MGGLGWFGVGEIVEPIFEQPQRAAYVRAAEVLPMERVLLTAYVTAGYLVSFYRRDDEEWWDYLDRAEAVIQATPAS